VATSKGPGGLARWATSTKNMMGIGFAAAGPILGVTVLANPLLGVALAPALYVVGALVAPGRKRPLKVSTSTDSKDAIRSLEEIQRRIRRRVPDPVARRVKYISASIIDSLRRADSLGEGSSEVYGLVKTATDYLPTALQTYLDLPRNYADRKVVVEGKTPLILLVEQLDLLMEKMDEIAEAVNRADSDKLIAHGRFLDEKFGKDGNGLDIE
jgi:hypothetical protein